LEEKIKEYAVRVIKQNKNDIIQKVNDKTSQIKNYIDKQIGTNRDAMSVLKQNIKNIKQSSVSPPKQQ
jgi:hypothetical protein